MNISYDETVRIIMDKVKREIRAEHDIEASASLADLGLGSLAMVSLIIEFEEHFDISYEDNEMLFEHFSTIQKITERIMGKLSFQINQN